jgi:integrase
VQGFWGNNVRFPFTFDTDIIKFNNFINSLMFFSKPLSEWYLDLQKVKALASYDIIKIKLDKFNAEFGDWIVANIKLADLENYQAKRLKAGLAPATVDHEIGKTKTMIIKAFDNDMVGGDILKVFKRCKPLLVKGSDVRTRILSKDEFEAVMNHLPLHSKPVFASGYYTGMRRGEIISLTWDKVDLKGRVIKLEASDTKDKERWCRRPDLNRHGSRHYPLKIACLPNSTTSAQNFIRICWCPHFGCGPGRTVGLGPRVVGFLLKVQAAQRPAGRPGSMWPPDWRSCRPEPGTSA